MVFVMKPSMTEMEKRRILSEVALGNIPPDIVITNGTVFNVFTREFIKGQTIWIKDGMIAYVGPKHDLPKGEKTFIIDVEEMVLLPGLIEGHTHLNRIGIEAFVKYVIPSGVTTVVMETSDIGMITGKKGMEYFVRGFEEQPIRCYYTLSPLCGLTLSEEINVPARNEIVPLLKNPNCLGIGEIYWSNIFLEGGQGERVQELTHLALELGKRIEGHGAGAAGKKLQAYTSFGVSSDHEPITEDEVMERLRLGYWVMIREGYIRKELPAIKEIFNKKIDFRRLTLATDGMDPEGFIEEGFLDASLKKALKLRVPPDLAYQMVTINVAEHFRLDHMIGSLLPGKVADMLVIPSPEEFSPRLVMCDGKIIFKDGKALVEPRKPNFPDDMFDTIKVQGYHFPSLPKKGKVRAIELITPLVTQEKIIDLEDSETSKDIIMLIALDRVGDGGAFMGLLKGFGLQMGAYGTTMSWDTIDMFVAGCDMKSMVTVIGRLKEIGGGGVYAIADKLVAEVRTPLCGLYSLKPMKELRDEVKQVEEPLRKNGVKWEKPLLTIDTLGTPAIPHMRITHRGYVRLRDRQVLSLAV
jgi:adenine deaminase